RQDPEQQVDARLEEHEDDPDGEQQHGRDDDEVDEELDDAAIAEPLEVLRRHLADALSWAGRARLPIGRCHFLWRLARGPGQAGFEAERGVRTVSARSTSGSDRRRDRTAAGERTFPLRPSRRDTDDLLPG